VTTGAMVAGSAASVPWTGVTGGGKPADNATVGGRVGVNIFPGSGSTPLPGTQLLNDQIGIDANGRLTNTGTGAVVVDNSRITLTDGALATVNTRTTTLEASARFPVPEAINKNPTFSVWSGASGTFPEDWSEWHNGTSNTKVAGSISPNAYRQSHTAGATNYGVHQSLDGKMTQGWYVFEADITLNSGVLTGSGMYLHYGPTGSITNSHTFSFAAEADIDGAVNGVGVAGRRYRYAKLVQLVNTAGSAQMFLMTNWDNYGTSGNAKDLTWHKCLIRPASDSEIELRSARGGAASVGARIATEESARASGDAALASRATTLEAQVANTAASGLQARISTEESARASGDAANASLITTLTAKTNGNANLFPYPTPVPNRTPTQLGWAGTSIGQGYYGAAQGNIYFQVRPSGGSATTQSHWYDLPDAYDLANDRIWTLSAVGYGGAATSGDRLLMQIEIWNSTYTTLLHASPQVVLNSLSTRTAVSTTYGAAYLSPVRVRITFIREFPSSGSYQDTVFTMIKFEAGPVATAFTNSAQVTVQANAIATINDSAAFWQVLVAASGGDPAIVRLFSGLGGSEISLAAKVLSLINTSSGVAMPVMRATGGEAFFQRPISSDFGSRRVTIGPGYGVSGSEVVLWFGPSTIAPASQSRTNCIFALGTDGIVYYGGTDLQIGGMQGTLNLYDVNLTRLGAGNTTQSMTATGFAPGTITYLWELLSGDAVNIGSTTAATTNIGHSLSVGQTKTSVVKCTMTSSAGPTTFRLLNISSSEIS
jgi:hypothetical protein